MFPMSAREVEEGRLSRGARIAVLVGCAAIAALVVAGMMDWL